MTSFKAMLLLASLYEQSVGLPMDWLQIRPFGSDFSSFSTNSYGYYSQMS